MLDFNKFLEENILTRGNYSVAICVFCRLNRVIFGKISWTGWRKHVIFSRKITFFRQTKNISDTLAPGLFIRQKIPFIFVPPLKLRTVSISAGLIIEIVWKLKRRKDKVNVIQLQLARCLFAHKEHEYSIWWEKEEVINFIGYGNRVFMIH